MTELEKLRHLLGHWIEHNDAHIKTYREWASKAAALGEQELSDIIDQIAGDSEKLNLLFHKARDLIRL